MANKSCVILTRNLKKKYGDTVGQRILDDIVYSKQEGPKSFTTWFGNWEKGEFFKEDLVDANGEPTMRAVEMYIGYRSNEALYEGTISLDNGEVVSEDIAVQLMDSASIILAEELHMLGYDFNMLFDNPKELENEMSSIIYNTFDQIETLLREQLTALEEKEAREIAKNITPNAADEVLYDTIDDLLFKIQNNPSNFRYALMGYLSTIDITVGNRITQEESRDNNIDYKQVLEDLISDENQDSSLDIDNIIDNSEEDTDVIIAKDSTLYLDSYQVNWDGQTPKAIVATLSTIALVDTANNDIVNSIGLPQSVNYKTISNLLYNLLADTPVDIEEQIKILKKNVYKYPFLESLILTLNYNNSINNTFKESIDDPVRRALQHQLRTQFVTQFGVTKINYRQLKVSISDDYNINPDTNKQENKLVNSWVNKYNSNYTKALRKTDGLSIMSKILQKGDTEVVLAFFGIDLSDPSIYYTMDREGNSTDFSKSVLEQFLKVWRRTPRSRLPDILENKKGYAYTTLKNLAIAKARIEGDITDQTHLAPNRSVYFGIGRPTFLDLLSSDIGTYSGSPLGLRTLISKYPRLFSPDSLVAQHSLIADSILNQGKKIQINVVEGITSRGSGTGIMTRKLDPASLWGQRFQNMREGMFHFIRTADRPTEYTISLIDAYGKIDTTNSRVDANYFASKIRNYIKLELKQVAYYEANKDSLFSLKQNGPKLRVFHDLADKLGVTPLKMIELIAPNNVDRVFTNESKLEAKVDAYIQDLISTVIKGETDYIRNNGVFRNKVISKNPMGGSTLLSQPAVISIKAWKAYMAENNNNAADAERAIISDSALTNYIMNMENIIFFVGDLANYINSDYVWKRMVTVTSSKKVQHVPSIQSSFSNHLYDISKENSLESIYVRLSNNNPSIGLDDIRAGNLRTITFIDPKIDLRKTDPTLYSDIHEELTTLFSKSNIPNYKELINAMLSSYTKIEYADGAALLTLDAYRRLAMREGVWYPNTHEKLYQKIVNKEKLDIATMRDITATFTPLKFQYVGANKSHTVNNIMAGRKFAFFPMIPGINIPNNSLLEHINTQMLASRVEIGFFNTASKFGVSNVFKFDSDFTLDDNSNIDLLDNRYMGSQVKINEFDKGGTITGSSQLRRFIFLNMFEKGNLSDKFKDIEESVEELLEMQAMRIRRNYSSLDVTLGSTEQDTSFYDRDLSSVAKLLQKMAIKQGKSQSIIRSLGQLAIHTGEGRLIKVLNQFPEFASFNSILSSLLKNNVMKEKRNGLSMVQAPHIGWESSASNFINNSSVDLVKSYYQSEDLKFYRKDPKTGRILPMQVILPLPNRLVRLVANKYGNGILTPEALELFNTDVKKIEAKFIKDGKITGDVRLISYIEYRTPNQGRSSSGVAHAIKFLMPVNGTQVIVPKELIAKNGSDFDVDKFNLYSYKMKFKDGELISNEVDLNKIYDKYIRIFKNAEFRLIKETLYTDQIKELSLREFATSPERFLYYTKDQFQNKMNDHEIEIILHPKNFTQLMLPLNDKPFVSGDISKYEGLADEMNRLKDNINEEIVSGFSDIPMNHRNLEKYREYLGALDNVGIMAVASSTHVYFQMSDVKLKLGVYSKLNLPTTTSLPEGMEQQEHNWADMGKTLTEEGYLISETLSNVMTGFLDVANNPWVSKVGLNGATINTFNLLIQAGLGERKTLAFINMPIINIWNTLASSRLNIYNKAKGRLISFDSFYTSFLDELGLSGIIPSERQLTLETMHSIISKYKTIEDIKQGSYLDKSILLSALNIFLSSKRTVESEMFNISQRMNVDKPNFKSLTILAENNRHQEEVDKSTIDLINSNLIFFKSPIHTIPQLMEADRVRNEFVNNIGKLILTHNPLLYEYVYKFQKMLKQNWQTRNKDISSRIMNLFHSQFTAYVFTRGIYIGANSSINDSMFNPTTLTKGDTSVGARIEEIQLNKDHPLNKNKFLEALSVDTKEDTYVVSFTNTTVSRDKNILVHHSHILSLQDPKLFNDIMYLSMLQTGTSNSPFNLFGIMSPEAGINLLSPSIDYFLADLSVHYNVDKVASIMEDFIDMFILNNPKEFVGVDTLGFSQYSIIEIENKKYTPNSTKAVKANYKAIDNDTKLQYDVLGSYYNKDYSPRTESGDIYSEDPILKWITGNGEIVKQRCLA